MKEEGKNVNTGAKESVGTKNKALTFDEVLRNKEYQAEFDRRVQKAIHTAQAKWQEKNNAEKSKADLYIKIKSNHFITDAEFEIRCYDAKNAENNILGGGM